MARRLKKILRAAIIVICLTTGLWFVQKTLAASIDLTVSGGLGTQSLTVVISQIIQVVLGFLGVIALGLVLYAGFLWMTAAGNEEKIAKAKKILINAAIGLVIILAAFAIVSFLINQLKTATGGDQPVGPVIPYNPGQGNGNEFYVQWVNPANNANNVSLCTVIQAKFNLDIVQNSIDNNFTLKVSGTTQTIPGALSANGKYLTFNPIDDLPASTDFEAIIEGNQDGIQGTVGGSNYYLNGDYIWTFHTGTISDNTPPQVSVIYPIDGKDNVCLNTPIQVQFNEPMWVSTIDNQDSMDLWFGSGYGSQYNGGYNVDANSVTTFTYSLNQLPLQGNTGYQPILNSAVIMDVCGNNLDGNDDGAYTSTPVGIDDYRSSILPITDEPNWNFITGETAECIPTITSISPSSGYYDDAGYITITGSDFGIAGDVKFNNNLLVYSDNICFPNPINPPQTPDAICLGTWSEGLITMKLPGMNGNSNGAVTGPVRVETGGGISNSVNFTVDSPHIDNLSPNSGGAGQFVTVWGSKFGAFNQADSKVYFFQGATNYEAILPCGDQGWQDNHIVMAVPNNLTAGNWNIQVKTKDGKWSNVDSFEVNSNPPGPGLCYLEPASGLFEDTFNLHGVEFGASQGTKQVMFGTNFPSTVSGPWAPTLITDALVPNLSPGIAPVSIKVNDTTFSNALPFNVLAPTGNDFYISYIEPDDGPVGQYVTIYGLGFQNTKGAQTVKFGDTNGDFIFPAACGSNFWTNTQIIVKVPPGAVDSDVKVYRSNDPGADSTNGVPFDVTTDPPSPGICSINPSQGTITPPTTVEIAGEPFNNVTVVNFSNINISPPFIEQTNEIIKVNIPPLAITGVVKVTDNGGRVSNPVNFEVLAGQANQAPFQHFDWQFTTCDGCNIPAIIFNPYCNVDLASPAPYPYTIDHHNDIELTLKFNSEMDENTFDWNNTVKLWECDTDLNNLPINCNTTPAIDLANTGYNGSGFNFTPLPIGELVVIDINSATPFLSDTWYKVELSGNLQNPEGYKLYNGSGYNDWYFKTQVGNLQCTVNQAVVEPVYKIAGIQEQVHYSSHAYNNENCDLCEQSHYLWSWSLENNSQNFAEFMTLNPPDDNLQDVFTLAVTPLNSPVGVKAQTSYINQVGQTVLLDNQGELNITDGSIGSPCDDNLVAPGCQNPNICNANQGLYCEPTSCTCQPIRCDGDLTTLDCDANNTICTNINPSLFCQESSCSCEPVTYPVVVEHGPDCGNACSNTSIFARFNMPMADGTLNTTNIIVKKCTDPNCNSFISPDVILGTIYDDVNFQININPHSILDEGWYRVILNDEIMSIGNYPPGSNNPPENLGGLNYSTGGGQNDAYSWTFGVSSEICEVQSVSVAPNTKVFTNQNQNQTYTAYPYSDGNCGAPLNQSLLNWSWSGEPVSQTIVNIPNVNSPQSNVSPSISGNEGSANVRATCDQPQGPNVTNTGNNGLVIVNYQGPQVLNQCVGNILSPTPADGHEGICINVAVSARFNMPMNEGTLNNIFMRSCGTDPTFNSGNCITPVNNTKTFLKNSNNNTVGFVASPSNPLNQNTWYQITIPISVESLSGTPMDQPYTWHFKTRDNLTSCQPNFIAVSPDESVVLNGATVDFNAYAMTAACDLILNTSYNWGWSSYPIGIATVNPATQNNATSTLTHVNAINIGETDIKAEINNISPVLSGLGHLIVTNSPEVEQPTVPPDNAQNICRNTEISANFNQLMDPQSINGNVIVQKETLTTAQNAQQLGCIFSRDGGTGYTPFNNYYKRFAGLTETINNFLNKLGLALINKELNVINKALAQINENDWWWCPVGGTLGTETILDVTVYKTKFSFTPYYPLNANTDYRVGVIGGPDGVKNIYDYEMSDTFGYGDWNFKTGSDICLLNYVMVYSNYVSEADNSSSWTFNSNVNNTNDDAIGPNYDTNNTDADKVYKAKAYSISGQPLIIANGVYEWQWTWESDNTVRAIVQSPANIYPNDWQLRVIAQNENGIANITATAEITVDPNYGTLGQERTGSAIADVFICENPWFDQLNPPIPAPGGDYSFLNGNFQDNDTNFKFKYCRDAGNEGTGDDLPLMTFTPIFHDNSDPGGNEDFLIKEYVFWIYDLEPPTNLSATIGSGSSHPVPLSWTGVSAADLLHYEIQRAGNPQFSPIQQTFSNITGTTYTDTVTGPAGTHFYYRVRANYANGDSSWSNIKEIIILQPD